MDRTTRCPKCGKRMLPVVTISYYSDNVDAVFFAGGRQ